MPDRILIVEDSATQAEALRQLLEDHGYAVVVARNGEQAFTVVAQGGVDLVLSDITMPGISGYEVCRRIKTELQRGDLPVILISGLSDPMDIVHGLEAGADNYITKPYTPEHLLARIRRVLDNRELRRGIRSRVGVNVTFFGSTFTITSEKEQILDLLISTFEDAVLKNDELSRREADLEAARTELARYAGTLEERLQSVLRSVPDVLFSTSPDGLEIYYISAASTSVLGQTPEQLASDPTAWPGAIHADDLPAVAACRRRAAEDGRAGSVEYRYRHPDGRHRWIQVTYVPARDAGGTVVRLDGVARDITGRRQLEDQLRVSQKMEAVGTLAGGIAHDFNNILAAIKTTVEATLLDVEADDVVREDLTQIDAMVDRAAALTRQLLAFGRRQVLDPRAVDLDALIANIMSMLQRILGEDIRLVMRPASTATTVLADPGQLEQVLVNFCTNARDALPDGGELALITERVIIDDDFCATHPWARPGDYVRLTVSDTGTGMDAATQARIFEPFFTTKELGRGTGLGLAMVYGIVKQHGGLIHVYSEVGKGTTFRVYLPFHVEGPDPVRPPVAGDAVGGTETILLAEDDAVLRGAAHKLLERLGYRVITAANGREALDAITKHGDAIHLVMLDVVMPEISGPDVVQAARSGHPRLRFLLTTGYSPGTSHLTPLHGLPASVLAKPYGLAALARAVRAALDG